MVALLAVHHVIGSTSVALLSTPVLVAFVTHHTVPLCDTRVTLKPWMYKNH